MDRLYQYPITEFLICIYIMKCTSYVMEGEAVFSWIGVTLWI